MTRIEELVRFGQSVWLDYISRDLIKSGRLARFISQGLVGMTSNPSIFDNAISKSNDYDDDMRALSSRGASPFEIYDELSIKDIRDAADLLKPVYEKTKGFDGYVSLEIDPRLAHNTVETVREGKRLAQKVSRPNVMFKVPATDEGYAAISELTSEGINVNVTLLFSLRQYEKTAESFLEGIARLLERGGDARAVHSVASVFVSRIDTAVDKLLEAKISHEQEVEKIEHLKSLPGKAAVANAMLIYMKHREIFASPGFERLKEKGANYQRVLWGSTSTKNPAYRDVKYIEELIVKHTVNTVPENTLTAFLDHGTVQDAFQTQSDNAAEIIGKLGGQGIDIEEVCRKLLDDGVLAFEKSIVSLLNHIEKKAQMLMVKG